MDRRRFGTVNSLGQIPPSGKDNQGFIDSAQTFG
jgi:hypothetical protein